MAKKTDLFKTASRMMAEDKKDITEKKMAAANFNVVLKNINELIPDENNEHEAADITSESIAELKTSILVFGLQNNLVVQAGTNKLVGGHRRLAALKELVAEGHREFQFAPCIEMNYSHIDIKGLSFEQKEDYGRIINNQQAKFSPGQLMKAINILEDIYKTARDAGDERFKNFNRSRDYVARELNIGTTTLSKLKSIDTKATDKVKEALEENIITQDTALSLTKEPEEVQNTIIENIINEVSNKAAEPEADYTFTKEDESEAVAEPKEPVTPSKVKESKIEVLKRADETKLNKIRNLISNLDSAEDVELDAVNALKVNQALDSIISNLKKVTDIIEK